MAEEQTKKGSFLSNLPWQAYAFIGGIILLLTLIAYFPVINIAGTEYHFIPVAVQVGMKFIITAFIFVLTLVMILGIHVWLFIQVINLYRAGKSMINDLIAWLDNM
jgi:hypothetical protein